MGEITVQMQPSPDGSDLSQRDGQVDEVVGEHVESARGEGNGEFGAISGVEARNGGETRFSINHEGW